MANTIKIKRGLKADLPTLTVGEVAYCTDTKELFIGTATGNELLNGAGGSTTASDVSFDNTISEFVSTNVQGAIDETISSVQTIVGLLSGQIADKQDTLVSGTNIKTINGNSLLGSGNITIEGGASGNTISMYRTTSDQANTTTTLADVTALSHNVVAGKVYKIELICAYRGAATTTGGKLGIYMPSGTGSITGFMDGSISATSVATELKTPIYVCGASNTAGSFLLTTGVSNINISHYIGGSMIFTCNTNGVIRMQWASEVASSNATLMANSTMLVTQLN